MLSYDDALARILATANPLPHDTVLLHDSFGRCLTHPIVATIDLPPFDNSAVDGYAVCADDDRQVFHAVGSVLAGQTPPRALTDGECMYIATGAMIPDNATGIVMIEDTEERAGGSIHITVPGSLKFARRRGSDVRSGETILDAGSVVDAGTIGLLAALGTTEVSCVRRPRVGILSTGDELVPIETATLPAGKIRDSNSHALVAAVEAAGGSVTTRRHVIDSPEATREALLALADNDLILTSGGVSVGGADFMKSVLAEIGSLDFWRVAIRPGKPLAFGRVGDALFVGLPGNPVSSLVTFELFVRPLLRRLAGHQQVGRPALTATLLDDLSHEPGRREFVRAHITYANGEALATTTGAQGSHRLASMIGANALLVAHENHGDYARGDQLPAFLLTS